MQARPRRRCRGHADRAGDGRHSQSIRSIRCAAAGGTAGGETSGAVVNPLADSRLSGGRGDRRRRAGAARAVGASDGEMLLALKSGNFGGPNFFSDALKLMR